MRTPPLHELWLKKPWSSDWRLRYIRGYHSPSGVLVELENIVPLLGGYPSSSFPSYKLKLVSSGIQCDVSRQLPWWFR